MPTMAERTVSANNVEQCGGLTVAETEAFISAFGLRPPPRNELKTPQGRAGTEARMAVA